MADRNILLVEDDPDDVALTLRAFEQGNIANEVVVVRDGVEALEYLVAEEGSVASGDEPPPALVLLDLQLPRVDGMEVLRRIRENRRTRTIPVVILTSSRHEEDVVEGFESGANSYIRKPVDFAEFTGVMEQLGLYWLLINEAPPLGRD